MKTLNIKLTIPDEDWDKLWKAITLTSLSHGIVVAPQENVELDGDLFKKISSVDYTEFMIALTGSLNITMIRHLIDDNGNVIRP